MELRDVLIATSNNQYVDICLDNESRRTIYYGVAEHAFDFKGSKYVGIPGIRNVLDTKVKHLDTYMDINEDARDDDRIVLMITLELKG